MSEKFSKDVTITTNVKYIVDGEKLFIIPSFDISELVNAVPKNLPIKNVKKIVTMEASYFFKKKNIISFLGMLFDRVKFTSIVVKNKKNIYNIISQKLSKLNTKKSTKNYVEKNQHCLHCSHSNFATQSYYAHNVNEYSVYPVCIINMYNKDTNKYVMLYNNNMVDISRYIDHRHIDHRHIDHSIKHIGNIISKNDIMLLDKMKDEIFIHKITHKDFLHYIKILYKKSYNVDLNNFNSYGRDLTDAKFLLLQFAKLGKNKLDAVKYCDWVYNTKSSKISFPITFSMLRKETMIHEYIMSKNSKKDKFSEIRARAQNAK